MSVNFSADDQNHKSKLQAAGKRSTFIGGICGLVVTENSKRANLRNILTDTFGYNYLTIIAF